MKIVDANILLYAVNSEADHHRSTLRWLDRSLTGAEVVGFTWVALLAFVRIATRPDLFAQPLTVDFASTQVDEWLAAPAAVLLEPGGEHSRILGEVLRRVGTGGNLVNDAHLAAIALERRAEIVSYDADFIRLGVRCHRPDDLLDL